MSKRNAAVAEAEAKEEVEEEMVQIGDIASLKPGQKKPTPAPANGDRVFYETLLEQIPESEMAQDWCLEYGVLTDKEAAKLYAKVQKRKANPTPVKKAPAAAAQAKEKSEKASSSSSSRRGKGKTVIEGDEEMDVEEGFGGRAEGLGTMSM